MAYNISNSWRLSSRSLIPGTEGERVDCSACKCLETREQESVMVNVIKWHGSQAPVSRTLNHVHCHHILSEKAWTDICGTTWFNTLYTRIVETMCEFQPSSYGSHVWLWDGVTTWTDSCFFLETWPGATFAREWTNYITCLTTGTIDNDPRKSSSYHPSWKSGIFAEILRYLTLDVINKGVFLRIRPQEETY